MKKLILFILLLGMFINGFSQIKFDSGYYVGLCDSDTIKTKYLKYLYLQFLSNEGDSVLLIVPYRMKNTDENFMNITVSKYLEVLSASLDNIEDYEINTNIWSINGFDNFTYYEIDNNKLSFAVNIADIVKDTIEIFYFDGIVNGDEINAVVYSDNNTFEKTTITLKYIYPSLTSKR